MRITLETVIAAVLFSVFVSAMGPSAYAEAPTRVAYSEKLGVEVFANPDSSGNWCRDILSLSLLLKDDSSLLASGVEAFIPKIGATLAEKCPTATGAKIAIYKDSDRSIVGAPLFAAKAESWVAKSIAAAPPPGDLNTVKPIVDITPTIPKDIGYPAALVRAVHSNLSLLQDDGVVRYWAAYRYNREFNQLANQEFKLQPLLQKAAADLTEAVAAADPERIPIRIDTQLGNYDFAHHQFPIQIQGDQVPLNKGCCVQAPNLPNSYLIRLPDLDSITGLPMSEQDAQSFLQRHTQWGNVNRSVTLIIRVQLGNANFVPDNFGNLAASGTVFDVLFVSPNDNKILYQLGATQLSQMRTDREADKAAAQKALADQQAALRRQQLNAQRDQIIKNLSGLPASIRLANFISPGPINYSAHLDNLASARGAAQISGKPAMVALLVQADGSGRNNVGTTWPGKLQVEVPDDQPSLKSGGWYLVRGRLTVPEADGLPPAQLSAVSVYACTQAKCDDATDGVAIVDRKLAATP